MDKIIKDWIKYYGYVPSDNEIISNYRNGQLVLTDKQENELINKFNL